MVATLIAGLLLPVQAVAVGPDDAAPKRDYAAMARTVGDGFAVGFDAVVVRPISVCAAIVGAVLFVPVFILSAAGGREARDEALEMFVIIPAKNVYERPLGEF